jgi:transcriptional regulator with XRE-family HTH domain
VYSVGKIIRERRQAQGLTQKELAELVGITQGHLSRIEQGKIDISLSQLQCFETILKCSLIDPPLNRSQQDTTQWFGISTLYELQALCDCGEYEDMLTVVNRALKADYFRSEENQLRLLYWQARAWHELYRLDEAGELYETLLERSKRLNDVHLTGTLLVQLGFLSQHFKEYERSIFYFEEAMKLQNEWPNLQHNTEFMHLLFYGLGCSYTYLNQLDKARFYLKKAVYYAELGIKSPMRQYASALYTVGAVEGLLGNTQEGLKYSKKSLEYFELINHLKGIIHAHNNIAYFYKLLGRLRESRKHYKRTVSMALKYPKYVSHMLRTELAKEGYPLPEALE